MKGKISCCLAVFICMMCSSLRADDLPLENLNSILYGISDEVSTMLEDGNSSSLISNLYKMLENTIQVYSDEAGLQDFPAGGTDLVSTLQELGMSVPESTLSSLAANLDMQALTQMIDNLRSYINGGDLGMIFESMDENALRRLLSSSHLGGRVMKNSSILESIDLSTLRKILVQVESGNMDFPGVSSFPNTGSTKGLKFDKLKQEIEKLTGQIEGN